jgi:hypothetical protein
MGAVGRGWNGRHLGWSGREGGTGGNASGGAAGGPAARRPATSGTGRLIRKPGSTHITGTATSPPGVFTVDVIK